MDSVPAPIRCSVMRKASDRHHTAAVPGFHHHWLVVDGVAVNDPGCETYFGYGRQTSGVEVPEEGVDFYDAQEVPHGCVRTFYDQSQDHGQAAAGVRLYAAWLPGE